MAHNINDISADESVVTTLWVDVNGTGVTTDGLGQKAFPTEPEAEAFQLGLSYLAERTSAEVVVSDVAYGRYGYIVRFATGKAVELWSN